MDRRWRFILAIVLVRPIDISDASHVCVPRTWNATHSRRLRDSIKPPLIGRIETASALMNLPIDYLDMQASNYMNIVYVRLKSAKRVSMGVSTSLEDISRSASRMLPVAPATKGGSWIDLAASIRLKAAGLLAQGRLL